jgi:hypothetical protein
MEARGINGQVHFDGVYVTLARRGFRARSIIGLSEKRIPLTAIGSIQWRPDSKLVNGYIQFSAGGDVERRLRSGRRNLDAARDENSVTFWHSQMPAFVEIRAAIEQARVSGPPASVPMTGPATHVLDPAAQLRRLDDLRMQGLITEQEYATKRTEIIGRL